MTDLVRVYPKPGARVRDPISHQVLPAEGADVQWGVHWERRRLDGDISLTPPAPPKKAVAKKE